MTRQGCVSSPFSLIQNRTDDPGASFALLRRKALQPLPQTFASFASNVCKYLQPSPQSIASFPASVCLFWHKRYPSPDFVHPIPMCRYAPPLLCSYDSKISLLSLRIFLWLWSFLQDAPFYLLYIMQDM